MCGMHFGAQWVFSELSAGMKAVGISYSLEGWKVYCPLKNDLIAYSNRMIALGFPLKQH